MTDVKQFLLNTDCQMDKIVYIKTGSIGPLALYGSSSVTIPHSFGKPLLPILQWSLTPDFDICYTDTTGPLPIYPAVWHLGAICSYSMDANNIYVYGTNLLTNGVTIYYRFICFEPYGSSIDFSKTDTLSNDLIISTDYNYPKLFTSGKVALSGASVSVPHNLGYTPLVHLWKEDIYGNIATNNTDGIISLSGTNDYVGVIVTTSNVTIKGNPSVSGYLHYRIYYDQI